MIRKIDDLGRLVLPIEMRKQLNINNGDEVNIESAEDKIILTNPKKDDRIERAIQYIENFGMDANGFDDIPSCFVKELYEILKEE